MKSLRKIFFACVFMILAVTASAQLDWGVKAGFNASTLNGLSNMIGNGVDYKNNYKPGFHLGLMAQYTLPVISLGFETGLYYSKIGSTEKYS
ncbi:MAG: PorT family protein, partial [Bacteroidales bacterium]|nr:PorT family protein [Bacteroidales bacterium]